MNVLADCPDKVCVPFPPFMLGAAVASIGLLAIGIAIVAKRHA